MRKQNTMRTWKKEHLTSRFCRVWSNQSAIFLIHWSSVFKSFIKSPYARDGHKLFNLLFLSIENILSSEYCRKHEPFCNLEQFFQNYVHFQENVNNI